MRSASKDCDAWTVTTSMQGPDFPRGQAGGAENMDSISHIP